MRLRMHESDGHPMWAVVQYAGVKDVVPGFADADHIETVKVCAGCHVQFHPTGVYVGHDGMERGEVLIRQLTVVL